MCIDIYFYVAYNKNSTRGGGQRLTSERSRCLCLK